MSSLLLNSGKERANSIEGKPSAIDTLSKGVAASRKRNRGMTRVLKEQITEVDFGGWTEVRTQK